MSKIESLISLRVQSALVLLIATLFLFGAASANQEADVERIRTEGKQAFESLDETQRRRIVGVCRTNRLWTRTLRMPFCMYCLAVESETNCRDLIQNFSASSPDQAAWTAAQRQLKSEGKDLNFDSMSAILPSNIVDGLMREGEALRQACEAGRSSALLRDCACMRQLYVDKRSEETSYRSFPPNGYNRHTLGDHPWKQCINETGTKQYAHDGCINSHDKQTYGHATRANFCSCFSEQFLSQYENSVGDGDYVRATIVRDLHVSSTDACRQ